MHACPNCGQNAGTGLNCQYCNQLIGLAVGVRLATPARRLGGYLLDLFFLLVTAIIGWLIWSLIVWKDGLTPAKQVLGMRVIKWETGRRAGWGTMALREFVGKFLVMGVIGIIPFASIVLSFMLLWDSKRQQLWDKIASTLVAYDPNRQL